MHIYFRQACLLQKQRCASAAAAIFLFITSALLLLFFLLLLARLKISHTMDKPKLCSATFIGLHDRTPEMRILYVTSSIRQALLYEPGEFVGHSSREFIDDSKDAEQIIKHLGSYSDDNAVITSVFAKSKNNIPIYIRTIGFACGNICFHMTTTYPNITIDILRERLTIRKYKCNLAETNTKPGEHLPHNSTSGSQGRSGNIVSTKGYMDVIDSLKKTHQACFVLKDLRSSNVDGSKGANIMFVTDSINRIINVDSCDLQNQPFLSLVAHEDVTRAAGFLEKALYGDALVVEKLHLLYDPLESSPLGKPKRVSVEFMAMGSDAGAILLCQLDKATGAARGKNNNTNNNNSDVYLSLEDIISSDPETSDFALMY